jgi:glycosyltransferase involved in cell wall biosynthesis
MRIAFGFDIFYPEQNGVITSSINLANNLIAMGHEVVFFVPNEKEFQEDVIEDGISIVHVKALDSFIYQGLKVLPVYSWYLNDVFIEQKIDMVHITSPWLISIALARCARKHRVPVLYTHHTLINDPIYINYFFRNMTLAELSTSAIWQIVFRPVFKLTWKITAPSKDTCKEVRNHVKNRKIAVSYISNGIDVSIYEKPKTREIPKDIVDFGIGDKTFLFVGRIGYEKGLDTLVAGFNILQKKYKDAKLIIIGQGPFEKKLKEEVTKLGLDDSIFFAGFRAHEEIIESELLNNINSFVTASLTENQSMTIIEALCSGVACITADVPNMTNLADEDSALYFKQGNVEDLAKKLEIAYTDIDLIKKKRIAAKKNINRFDGRNVAKEFEEEYYKLLEKKKEGFYIPRSEFKKI